MGGTVPACGGPWGPPRCPLPVLVPGLAKPRASGAHSCPQCSEGTAYWAWTSEPGDAGGPSLVAPTSGGPASGSQLWEPLPLSPARRPLPPTAGATCTPPGSVRHCPAWRLPCLRATPSTLILSAWQQGPDFFWESGGHLQSHQGRGDSKWHLRQIERVSHALPERGGAGGCGGLRSLRPPPRPLELVRSLH